MRRRSLRTLAILPVLFAVFSAGLLPHLHHAHAGSSEPQLEQGSASGAPFSAAGIDAGECLACRSGQSDRSFAIAPSPAGLHETGSLPAVGPRTARDILVERWLRAPSPPRAPPV